MITTAPFNLDEYADLVYRTGLSRNSADPGLLASWLRWPVEQVRAALATLVDQGLCLVGEAGPSRLLPPEEAFRRRAELLTAEVERLQSAADEDLQMLAATGLDQYAAGQRRTGTHAGVEMITDATAIRDAIRAQQDNASKQVDFIGPCNGQPPMLREADLLRPDLLTKGLTLRGIWCNELPASPAMRQLAADGGVRLLTVNLTLMRGVAWDSGRAALLPANAFGPAPWGILMVRNPMLARAVWELVNSVWRRGQPWDGVSEPLLSTRHRTVLILVAAGRTDEAIAREMRMGLRSVRRYVHEMSNALGVVGRAALAAEAVRRGIID
jgi:DNA-binding CsgD family transcriptional regulator